MTIKQATSTAIKGEMIKRLDLMIDRIAHLIAREAREGERATLAKLQEDVRLLGDMIHDEYTIVREK